MLRKKIKPDSRIIHIDGIGPVTLERSLRARRVVIYIRPFRGIRVAVPARESFKSAEAFVLSKMAWIKRRLAEMRQYEKKREIFRANFENIDMTKARKALSSRLEQLADKHGFKYNRLTIRRQRTRWGSCSHKNNISLNANLLGLPAELRDYVILHELVHTRVHNHSQKFWAELEKYAVNARSAARKLRENGLELV